MSAARMVSAGGVPSALPVTLASSDEAMILVLQADEALLSRVQAAAQTAYMAARALRNAPFNGIDRTWQDLQTASLEAIAKAGGRDVIGTRRAADWTARVAMLRTAMEAGDHFRALVTRYDTISELDRERAAAQDAMEAASLRARAGAATIVSPPFNAQPLLADLAQRGIHVSASAGGAILASPSRFLTVQDREALRAHKAAIVAALDDVEVF